jgi:hypothetical protein
MPKNKKPLNKSATPDQKIKEFGNAAFIAGKYQEAVEFYT